MTDDVSVGRIIIPAFISVTNAEDDDKGHHYDNHNSLRDSGAALRC